MALKRGLLMLLAVLALTVPLELPGCGGGPALALFVLSRQPEQPKEFAAGQLGVLRSSHHPRYLVVAYRYLNGTGLNEKEREAIFAPVETAGDAQPWNNARAALSLPAARPPEAYLPVSAAGYLEIQLNCGSDAFRTAALTLQDRERRFGASSPLFRDWVQAQDIVFSNCAGPGSIPQPSSEPALRADREYQIAAARFYARRFEEARSDFERIALDAESPWRNSAPYLAARCLIRDGKLTQAEERLGRIRSDPSLSAWHEPARRLRNFVVMRTRPAERLHELAEALVRPGSEKTIAQDLIDYTRSGETLAPRADDLSDWIAAFREGDHEHALERWRSTHSVAWLLAALDGTPALLADAAKVPPDSPAYATVSYMTMPLLPESEARAKADAVLRMNLPVSAHNLFLAERMRLARDWAEFVRYAPRRPVGTSWIDGESAGAQTGECLDRDSTAVMNQYVPLSLLKRAVADRSLPGNLRRELGRTTYTRTVVLSASPAFEDVLTLLRSPGLSPWVRQGFGRQSDPFGDSGVKNVPGRLDPFRDNWWSAAEAAAAEVPEFLSPAERRQAALEWEKLKRLPPAVNWLGAQTLAFAAAHPEDPRVPEALHRVVRASHYGPKDERSGNFSRGAFELLHRRYSGSEWTAKTPYWYQ